MKQVSFRVGTQVGFLRARWPVAKLTADSTQLTLSGFGTYTFSTSDVVALEPYDSIPFLGTGREIRVRHNRSDYPERVVFWRRGNREEMLAELADVGFCPKGRPGQARPSEFPVRWSVLLAVGVLWSTLLLLDIFRHGIPDLKAMPLGPFSILALAMLFGVASAIRMSIRVQNLVMREGHSFVEIKNILPLTQFVSGMMALVLVAFLMVR